MPDNPDIGGSSPPTSPRPDGELAKRRPRQVGAAAAVDEDPDRDWTAEDIQKEHQAVMASFTPLQARAIARINRAFRESHMGNMSAKDAMVRVYEEEAGERNRERASRAGESEA